MNKTIIIGKPHSSVDLITNSSTVIFTVNDSSVDMIREIIFVKCQETDDLDWFERDLTVDELENNTIEIYSFVNDPDWFCDFIKNNFNVVDEWYCG